ncbi:nucleoside diphosphate kinase regulator [Halobacteriovorax sp.]|uniref:nucleoside diphosphate kinase regulator n=1 Tax=Halobacteriovorax sp. TaxID=2020862 RepID=UPI0035694B52
MNDEIIMTEKDYLRLNNLLKGINIEDYENLEIELERAKIVLDNELPAHVVTMNSTLEYTELKSGKTQEITIVYPQDSDPETHKVSILAPLASALIGLSVGQEINWMFPSGETKRLKVTSVKYQPEASGDYEL